ncbi:MAG: hypothetical protein RIQ60_3276 [Pseudomonadota bacterium]|jgi:hypothetical protein
MTPSQFALLFTVVLLAITAYFLLGGLPLLILKHDVALDARFIRSFFNLYFKVAMVAALGGTVSYFMADRWAFAVGGATITLLAVALRSTLIPAMDNWGGRISEQDSAAVRQFRRVHATALALNVAQLLTLLVSLTRYQP